MHPTHLPKVLTDGLGASVQYLAILLLLFPALAYAYAAIKQRRRLVSSVLKRQRRRSVSPAACALTELSDQNAIQTPLR